MNRKLYYRNPSGKHNCLDLRNVGIDLGCAWSSTSNNQATMMETASPLCRPQLPNYSPTMPSVKPSRKRTRSMYLAGMTQAVAAPIPHVSHPPHPPSKIALAMMRKMGYEPGMGLGASKQGRLQPVGMGAFRGRAGIGHSSYHRSELAVGDNSDDDDDEWVRYYVAK